MTRVVIVGAAGRMGRAIVRAARECSDVQIVGAVTGPSNVHLGQDVGELSGLGAIGLKLTSDLPSVLDAAEVVIDFSVPQTTRANLTSCRTAGKPYLVGTTGLAAELRGEFARAAREIAVLVAPNTSVGITVLIELVRMAAMALPVQFDVGIIESHHRMKRDAPSGTARALAEAAASARALQEQSRASEQGGTALEQPRSEAGIAVASVRGGDIIGDHTVLFAGDGERLSLTHQATDRGVFARGALRAALWLSSRSPGEYFMRDILYKNNKI